MSKIFLPSTLLLAFILISGCTVGPNYVKSPIQTPLEDNEGVLVVSFAMASNRISHLRTMEVEIQGPINKKFKSKNKESTYRRKIIPNRLDPDISDTAVFIGTLPAGEYKLIGFSNGLTTLQAKHDGHELISNITIESGKATDLGRIIVANFNNKPVVSRSAILTSNKKIINDRLKEYSPILKLEHIHGWTKDRDEHDKYNEEFAYKNPMGITAISANNEGVLYAGSRLGTTFVRRAEGNWDPLARNDDLATINFTFSLAEGTDIAGTANEFSDIHLISKDLQSRKIYLGDLPKGKIIFVDEGPSQKFWIVGVIHNTQYTLYRSQFLENGQWTELISDTVENSAWSGAQLAWAWRRDNGLGFASTAKGTVNCLDYESGQWTSYKAPEERRLQALVPGLENSIGIVTGLPGGFGGVFGKTHYTLDCGKTWTETNSPYEVKVVAPIYLGNNTVIEGGGVFNDTGIYESSNKGISGTWTKISEENILTNSLFVTKNKHLYFTTREPGGWEIIHQSIDLGNTWTIDYDSRQIKGIR